MPPVHPPAPPPSTTRSLHNWMGLVAAALVFAWLSDSGQPTLHLELLLLSVLLLTIGALDLIRCKTHRRASAGLDLAQARPPDLRRVAVKLLGLAGTLGLLALWYWLIPEYHGGFYHPAAMALRLVGLPLLVLLAGGIFFLDGRLRQPEDGFFQAGLALLGRFRRVDQEALRLHLLGWAVKGFFTPIMFVYLCCVLEDLRGFAIAAWTPGEVVRAAVLLTLGVDLLFTVAGYLFSTRVLDTHLRSVDATLLGWLVTLVCYRPLWDGLERPYFAYHGDNWEIWVGQGALGWVWGGAICLCLFVYAWSTLTFGLRFSNLTHRGILTNGPYRLTRHPAYLSKNLSWWLISMPFLSNVGVGDALRRSLLLLLVNGIYFLRARTEERHLGRDPVYRAYADWMDRHGPLRFLSRRLLFLRFRPPPGTSAPVGEGPCAAATL
ncbi:MAG: DUF1295 domain-containing protein [Myxococcales bacterium]|nr:DUF1295 domain-containing protein [Myxococcales bacterium]